MVVVQRWRIRGSELIVVGGAMMVGHWISDGSSDLAGQGWSLSQGRSLLARQQW